MVVFNVHQIPRFEGLRLSTLGGVREHTDIHTYTHSQTVRQTDRQTHRGVSSFNNIDYHYQRLTL